MGKPAAKDGVRLARRRDCRGPGTVEKVSDDDVAKRRLSGLAEHVERFPIVIEQLGLREATVDVVHGRVQLGEVPGLRELPPVGAHASPRPLAFAGGIAGDGAELASSAGAAWRSKR